MARWLVTRSGGAVTATLDGGRVNSLDEEALRGLTEVLAGVEQDDRVRVLVLTGTGRTFCIGLDIDLLGRAFDDHAYFRDVLVRYHALLGRIETLPVPVVAAVNGTTRAGGFELLLACDLVLAAEEARVADHHLHFGILPGGGATARLPRHVGRARARELLLTARWLKGPELVDYGLAVRCVPAGRLPQATAEIVATLVDKPRAALAQLKRLLAVQDGLSLDAACRAEVDHFCQFLAEPGAAEGYRAFVEGREPAWRGER